VECTVCRAALGRGALFCGSCGRSTGWTSTLAAATADADAGGPGAHDTTIIAPLTRRPDIGTTATEAAATAVGHDGPDAEGGVSAGFTLRFSTGEEFSVNGAGLVGRRPVPAEGELFEHVLRIHDPGRSVSKTHLEFHVAHGVLWVLDRASANGSLLTRPGQDPLECEPGHAYEAPRGTRVDLGDQHMIVH